MFAQWPTGVAVQL